MQFETDQVEPALGGVRAYRFISSFEFTNMQHCMV